MSDALDVGDKVVTGLSYKKNLGNYESMAFNTGVTVSKREGESDDDVWARAWKTTEYQLDDIVERAETELSGKAEVDDKDKQ